MPWQCSPGAGPVAPHFAEVNGLLPLYVLDVDISPSSNQYLDAVLTPLTGCLVKGRHSVLVLPEKRECRISASHGWCPSRTTTFLSRANAWPVFPAGAACKTSDGKCARLPYCRWGKHGGAIQTADFLAHGCLVATTQRQRSQPKLLNALLEQRAKVMYKPGVGRTVLQRGGSGPGPIRIPCSSTSLQTGRKMFIVPLSNSRFQGCLKSPASSAGLRVEMRMLLWLPRQAYAA